MSAPLTMSMEGARERIATIATQDAESNTLTDRLDAEACRMVGEALAAAEAKVAELTAERDEARGIVERVKRVMKGDAEKILNDWAADERRIADLTARVAELEAALNVLVGCIDTDPSKINLVSREEWLAMARKALARARAPEKGESDAE